MLNKTESNVIFLKTVFNLSFFGGEKDYNFHKFDLLYSSIKRLLSNYSIVDSYSSVKNVICVFEI